METSDRKRSVSSVIAIILAIIGLLLSPIPIINNVAFFFAILAIIFAIVGLRKAKKRGYKGKKLATVALVLGLISCGVVLATQAWYGNELDKAGKQIQDSADKATGKKTDQILGKEVDVKLGQFSATTDQYGIPTTELPVTVTNKASQAKTYSIQIEVVDSTGKRIADDTVYANNLGAKQSQDFKAFQYVDSSKLDAVKAGTFKVATVSQY